MHRFKRILVRLLLLTIISIGMPDMPYISMTVTAYAAEKAPALKEQKITLYTGYKDYTIAINNFAKGAQVSYKSANSKIAKVSSKGVIKAVSAGSTTITATVKQNKKTYSLKLIVTVKKPYISLTQSVNYLNTGESAQFNAKVYGTDSKISWSSSDPELAEVSSKGMVTAKKSGTVTIYASAGKLTASCRLDVGTNRLGCYSTNLSLYDDYTIWITVTDAMEGENLQWQSNSGDIINCEWAKAFEGNRIALTIKPLKPGRDTIAISSNKTNDKLFINVEVEEKPGQRNALNAEEIYELCSRSTVEINAYYNGELQALGSGFYIDKGMIVTNYHVIEGAERVTVKTFDEETVEIKSILGYDKELDIAILGTDKEITPLSMSRDRIAAGQDVYAIGSPFGLTGTMSKGMITSASRKMDKVDYIQIDASVSEGNSGGPLINKYGEVIGIITMYLDGGQNLNFAINIKELWKINTNRPLSIKEYTELYDKMLYQDMIDNAVVENPMISKKMDTCQEIPSNTVVVGSLKPGEEWDLYKFEMDNYGYFYGFIYYDEETGIDNTYFVLMDDYDEYIFAEKEEDKNIAKLYEVLLSPGTYYIAIMHKNENYEGEDINYLFYTVRTPG